MCMLSVRAISYSSSRSSPMSVYECMTGENGVLLLLHFLPLPASCRHREREIHESGGTREDREKMFSPLTQ